MAGPQHIFESYRNPFAGSISDMIARRGEDLAQGTAAAGAYQGRGQELSGQIWGHGIAQAGADVAAIPEQIRVAKTQQTELETRQRVLDAQKALSTTIKNTPKIMQNGAQLSDVRAIAQGMADAGFGAEGLAAVPHLSQINEQFLTIAQEKQKLLQMGAQKVAAAGNDPTLAHDFLDQVESNGLATPEQTKQYRAFIDADPANVAKLTAYFSGPQKVETAAPGSSARDPITGKIIEGSQAPEEPGKGDYTINGQRFKADGTPIGTSVPKEPDPGAAGREAEIIRHNKETERIAGLSAGREAATLAETKRHNKALEDTKNAPLDVSSDVQTMRTGEKYVDVSLYTGTARNAAIAGAKAAGAIPVNKDEAAGLADIDTVRANQKDLLDQVNGLLPKDAAGRVLAMPTTALSKMFQTNEQRAAFGSWRTAAIRTMRALAGSKGLRINQAEIELAIENDIPQLTDTLGTAKQKLANIDKQLTNAAQGVLVRDRSELANAPAAAAPVIPQALKGLAARP